MAATKSSRPSPTPTQLMAAVADHRPNLVILDVRMPPTFTDEGTRAARELKDAAP